MRRAGTGFAGDLEAAGIDLVYRAGPLTAHFTKPSIPQRGSHARTRKA